MHFLWKGIKKRWFNISGRSYLLALKSLRSQVLKITTFLLYAYHANIYKSNNLKQNLLFQCGLTEAGPAVEHKVHIPLMNQIRGEYAPISNEIAFKSFNEGIVCLLYDINIIIRLRLLNAHVQNKAQVIIKYCQIRVMKI